MEIRERKLTWARRVLEGQASEFGTSAGSLGAGGWGGAMRNPDWSQGVAPRVWQARWAAKESSYVQSSVVVQPQALGGDYSKS